MNGLAGRTAVVTGAARGIGLAVVCRLVTEGGRVHGVDLDVPEIEAIPDVAWHELDASDEAALKRLFRDEVEHADALANCAGLVEDVSVAETSLGQWDTMLRHNLSSAYLMTREFAAQASTSAAVVNVGSVDAHFGSPARAGYAVAKGAVEAFTRVAAGQLAAQGIRVNAVVPGAVATRMSPDPAAGQRCVLRRRGRPEEVAAAIVFLLSDDASYITGATLRVDGGYGLR